MANWKVRVYGDLPANPDGQIRINILCPKCESEMTELEFNRIATGNRYIWECFRKCPECGTKIELNNP